LRQRQPGLESQIGKRTLVIGIHLDLFDLHASSSLD
jgi:hypothetical protein